ncbi:hypothetical protein RUND412_010218 [Rhizina undulata]
MVNLRNPAYLRVPGPQTIDNITCYDPETGLTHPRSISPRYKGTNPSQYNAHYSTVAIRADGSCLSNGRVNARCGLGVFFAQGSGLNCSHPLCSRDHNTQTSQYAELQSAIMALKIMSNVIHVNEHVDLYWDVQKIVLAMDSNYVIKGMTQWIHNWRRNG